MVLDGRARDLGLAISILPLEELRPGLVAAKDSPDTAHWRPGVIEKLAVSPACAGCPRCTTHEDCQDSFYTISTIHLVQKIKSQINDPSNSMPFVSGDLKALFTE